MAQKPDRPFVKIAEQLSGCSWESIPEDARVHMIAVDRLAGSASGSIHSRQVVAMILAPYIMPVPHPPFSEGRSQPGRVVLDGGEGEEPPSQ